MLFGETKIQKMRSFERGKDHLDLEASNFSTDIKFFLQSVAANSPYLAQLITSHANFLKENIDRSPEEALRAARDTSEPLGLNLRRSKARTALILALCDLAGIRDLEWVTGQLTEFADYSVETVLRHSLHQIRDKLPKNALKDLSLIHI